MGEQSGGSVSSASLQHHIMLLNVIGSISGAKESLVYSYGRSFNGFAARLTDEQVERFSEMEGVVSVLPNTILKLHTTRSWDFLGLPQTHSGSSKEGDIIVALLDTDKYETAKIQQLKTGAMNGLESCVDQAIKDNLQMLPHIVDRLKASLSVAAPNT